MTSRIITASASSWIAPPVRSPVADLLSDLGSAFAALDLSWFLFGAQASILYGAARLTGDVDVTVRPGPASSPVDWMPTLQQHGFDLRFGDEAFAATTRVLPLVHRATGLPTDMVLAGPGLEEQFLERAVTRDIDGVSVPVIEVTDLVILKVLAGRPKDVEDVVMLLGVQRQHVDLARARDVLRLLEQALGQSDLLNTLDDAIGRSEGR
jgi:hypothetical protein